MKCKDCGISFDSMIGEKSCLDCCRKTPNPFRKTKVHIGCGKRNFGPDWWNIDGEDFPHIHSKDIATLPFSDDSVNLIYASHVIEYFDREEVIPLLSEWKRVLKPGKTLRLAVPNFSVMARLYNEGKYPLKNFLGPIFGKMKMGNKWIYHKTTYDSNDLMELLSYIGFKNIRRYNWWETEHSSYDDHSMAHLPHMDKNNGVLISLNIECEK